MEPFKTLTSLAAPLDRTNVDTDQIIPKQFLKRIERTGYGDFLFFDWRQTAAGEPIADFVLNDPRYKGAQIMVAGKNFGCGSSREHAPWAILDYGFRGFQPKCADARAESIISQGMSKGRGRVSGSTECGPNRWQHQSVSSAREMLLAAPPPTLNRRGPGLPGSLIWRCSRAVRSAG